MSTTLAEELLGKLVPFWWFLFLFKSNCFDLLENRNNWEDTTIVVRRCQEDDDTMAAGRLFELSRRKII